VDKIYAVLGAGGVGRAGLSDEPMPLSGYPMVFVGKSSVKGGLWENTL